MGDWITSLISFPLPIPTPFAMQSLPNGASSCGLRPVACFGLWNLSCRDMNRGCCVAFLHLCYPCEKPLPWVAAAPSVWAPWLSYRYTWRWVEARLHPRGTTVESRAISAVTDWSKTAPGDWQVCEWEWKVAHHMPLKFCSGMVQEYLSSILRFPKR